MESVRESGLAKELRSASSSQGRRWERPSRREEERRERNVRKAWVLIGGWGWGCVACWLVTGRVAGEDIGVGYGVCARRIWVRERVSSRF